MEKSKELLEKSMEHLNSAEHMIYVNFMILREYRMLIKIFNELYNSAKNLIIGLLHKEQENMKIFLFKSPELNYKIFRDKVALKYMNEDDLSALTTILRLQNQHKYSQMEFVRKDKFVILKDNGYEIITLNRLKKFFFIIKKILNKTS